MDSQMTGTAGGNNMESIRDFRALLDFWKTVYLRKGKEDRYDREDI